MEEFCKEGGNNLCPDPHCVWEQDQPETVVYVVSLLLNGFGALAGVYMLHNIWKHNYFSGSSFKVTVAFNVVLLTIIPISRLLIWLTNALTLAVRDCTMGGCCSLFYTCYVLKSFEYFAVVLNAPISITYLVWYALLCHAVSKKAKYNKNLGYHVMFMLTASGLVYLIPRLVFMDKFAVTPLYCDGQSKNKESAMVAIILSLYGVCTLVATSLIIFCVYYYFRVQLTTESAAKSNVGSMRRVVRGSSNSSDALMYPAMIQMREILKQYRILFLALTLAFVISNALPIVGYFILIMNTSAGEHVETYQQFVSLMSFQTISVAVILFCLVFSKQNVDEQERNDAPGENQYRSIAESMASVDEHKHG